MDTEKHILDSIIKTEDTLTELLEACKDYRTAIAQKDLAKAKEAMSVFEDCTETKYFRLSIESPVQSEDSLAEIFGEGVVFSETEEEKAEGFAMAVQEGAFYKNI